MNPMTNVKNIQRLSQQELKRNLKTSWHDQYKNSAWIFIGGLPYDLTEGDIICVFSQYGEVVNINLVRDKGTGKSKGFCFLCYEDQRSTVLAVDNFNSMKLLGRTLRVDHVQDYKAPKDSEKKDAETRRLQELGCAPAVEAQLRLAPAPPQPLIKQEKPDEIKPKRIKEEKEEKRSQKDKRERKEKVKEKEKRKKKKRRRTPSSSSSSESPESSSSSSSDSSGSDNSSSSSDSEEDVRAKKRAKKKKEQTKKKKKSSKRHSESSSKGEGSASSKRRKLQAKIEALERALKIRANREKL